MAQVIPVTKYTNATLVGLAKKLATDMERGARAFLHAYRSDDGSIEFQKVGDKVRAIVSSNYPTTYIGVAFPNSTEFLNPVFVAPVDNGAFNASAYNEAYRRWALNAVPYRQTALKLNSDNGLAQLRAGILPPEWEYELKRSAPVSRNVSRAVRMTTGYSDEVIALRTADDSNINRFVVGFTVRRTVRFNYVSTSGETKKDTQVGTYTYYQANPTTPVKSTYSNWYIDSGTSMLDTIYSNASALAYVTTPYTISGRVYPDLGAFLRAPPNNYTDISPTWYVTSDAALSGSSSSTDPAYNPRPGAPVLGYRAPYNPPSIDVEHLFIKESWFRHQFIADGTGNGMGLLWSGEESGAKAKYTATAFTGLGGSVSAYAFTPSSIVNTLVGVAPQIVLDYRKAYPPVYVVGDSAWCDSALFDLGIVQVTPFGLVADDKSLGIYVVPTDRARNTVSGPGFSATYNAPDQIEVYGSAFFQYNHADGSFRFMRWEPLKDLKGNIVSSRRAKITEVPSYNAIVKYQLQYGDTIVDSIRSKASIGQADATMKIVLDALSPQ